MSFDVINTKLKSVLDGVSKLQQVYEYPTEKFDGFPSATITPSENSADFETNNENERNYAFIIRLFQDIPNSNVEGEKPLPFAFRVLRLLVDDTLDKFDKDETLSGISMPTGYTMLNLSATPSSWGAVVGLDQKIIMAEIIITVKVSFDTKS